MGYIQARTIAKLLACKLDCLCKLPVSLTEVQHTFRNCHKGLNRVDRSNVLGDSLRTNTGSNSTCLGKQTANLYYCLAKTDRSIRGGPRESSLSRKVDFRFERCQTRIRRRLLVMYRRGRGKRQGFSGSPASCPAVTGGID